MAENMNLIHLGTWSLGNCVPKQKILAKALVFIGGFEMWAQVCGKGLCVGNILFSILYKKFLNFQIKIKIKIKKIN